MHRLSHRVLGLLLVFSVPLVLSGCAWVAPKDGPVTAAPLAREVEAVDAALEYILTQQGDDGSFGGSVGITLDAIFAGTAADRDVSGWRTAEGNPNPIEYLEANWEGHIVNAANTGKLVVGLVAAGHDPRDFAGQDFVEHILSFDKEGTGSLGTSALDQAWGMLGVAAAGTPVTQEMVAVLIGFQQSDGGWEFAPDSGADSNTTALALQALVAAGVGGDDTSITRGLDFLATQQSPTGGFAYSTAFGTEADANSTAYCLQALIATGANPASEEWRKDGNGPLDALLDFQLSSGAFEWQPGEGENLLATAQAVPALLGEPLSDIK